MKTYIFPIHLEESEGKWHVVVPELEHKGAATWGYTRDDAMRNIQEVMQMVLEEMIEEGEPLPQSVKIADAPSVAVSV